MRTLFSFGDFYLGVDDVAYHEVNVHLWIATLLWVASHEGGHKTALEMDLNLSTASTSRNTDWLAKKNPILGRPALGLIVKEPDETNKRRVTLSLSSKGRDLIKTIKEILYE